MNAQQRTAIARPVLIAEECMLPLFRRLTPRGSVVVTVNAGYE